MAISKPSNYEETQASGSFTPVSLGGHHLVIKQVKEHKSGAGKDMIVVLFDFDKNDSQPAYFMESYKNDIRPDKKWSNQATEYIMCEDSEGNCSRTFKTFVTCVEHSNKNFNAWNPDDTLNLEAFKNKKVGGVFGEQLDFYDGKEKKKVILRWFVSSDKVKDAEIPNITESKAYKERPTGARPNADGFVNIPDGIDEELPFA